MEIDNARLLIVVEVADYREAIADVFWPETLPTLLPARVSAADAHLLTAAARWQSQLQAVGIFSCYSETRYSETAPLGIHLLGSGLTADSSTAAHLATANSLRNRSKVLVRLVADFCPTHIVLCSPQLGILNWARLNHIPSLALLSEWQEPLGWQQRQQHNRLVAQLNHDSVRWVGAQGVCASTILAGSGIEPRKLIPWQWPQPQLPSHHKAKQLRPDRRPLQLIYAGPLAPQAGTDDLLSAASELEQRGKSVQLTIASIATENAPTADTARAQNLQKKQLMARSQQLHLKQPITFLDALSTDTLSSESLIAAMRAADLAIFPGSLSAAADEQPPLSLLAAMAARTPIVAANCPPLDKYLLHNVNAMLFPAGNAKSMAHRIERIMGQPQLYAQLSEAAKTDLLTLQVPTHWAALVDRWLHNSPANEQWLSNYAFSSGRYRTLAPLQRRFARPS